MKGKDSLPDKQIIRTYIQEICERGDALGKTGRVFQAFLQEEIAHLATEFFLRPEKEFLLPNALGDQRNGYIDVVWAIGSTPIVAIEIDGALREKSIRKLLASRANVLFWVYYGNRDFEMFLNSIDLEGRIEVIHFPRPRYRRKTSSLFSKSPGKRYSVSAIRVRYPNAYTKWSKEQEEALVADYKRGVSIDEIARRLRRQPGAIQSRLRKLGLCP